MKRMFVFLVFPIALMLFSGCKKDLTLRDHPGALSDICRINQIITHSSFTIDTLTFNYNKWNNPVYIERNEPAASGYLNYVFKYDSRNRLSDYIGIYHSIDEFDGTLYEFWHRYVYDNKDRIIADTNYMPSSDEFPPPGPGQIYQYTDSIEYDAKNRVVKEVTHNFVFGVVSTFRYHYNYNSNDNLESRIRITSTEGYPDGYDTTYFTGYDNKVNIHRTNKIWMYIDKNYSLNNPFSADEYNNFGLPVRYTPVSKGYIDIFFGYTPDLINYRCK